MVWEEEEEEVKLFHHKTRKFRIPVRELLNL